MPSISLDDLSPFGRAAVKLDREFAELVRAGGEMADTDIESDSGLDQSVRILNRAAEYTQSMADTLQEFTLSLDEARAKAETAAKLIAERGQSIQKRRQQEGELQERLTRLKDEVKDFGAGLTGFAAPADGAPSEEEKKRIAAELESIQAPMIRFIEAIQGIKAEAAASRFKRVERQAEAMVDSLQSTRRKIEQALASKRP